MNSKYICINKIFYSTEENSLHHKNRAFTYGDAIFETIHCLGTTPQFIDNHFARLSQGMKVMRMDWDNVLSKDTIVKYIGKLLNKNRIFKGARIRLTVFRDSNGFYTPMSDRISWLMESVPLEDERYNLNQVGLHVDIFDEVHKPVNVLSNLKSTNAIIYVLAGVYKRKEGLDECFILNQFGRIVETISSNIFICFEDKIV
jgi:branched-chain amino acid aminotransferase